MKTSIKTLFATALTALFLTTSAFASFENDTPKSTVAATAMNVNMVVTSGNVDVYLIHGNKENIKVVPFGNEEAKVSIKKKGGKLFISSVDNNRVTVYVYLKDLKRIDASQNTTVSTQGDFNLDALQILLKDNARANVKAHTTSLYTVIKDHSKLKLSGTTLQHQLVKGEYVKLKMDKFNSGKTQTMTVKSSYAANKK
ncbi:GIN domain-containing protein [Pedobacter sp.]|uniref:GIN domain-containing protein n=1 Tax=Pedobacter sp. TaxID=1411316 RepID=UPI003D7FC796